MKPETARGEAAARSVSAEIFLEGRGESEARLARFLRPCCLSCTAQTLCPCQMSLERRGAAESKRRNPFCLSYGRNRLYETSPRNLIRIGAPWIGMLGLNTGIQATVR
jgi:hypothetical protein